MADMTTCYFAPATHALPVYNAVLVTTLMTFVAASTNYTGRRHYGSLRVYK